MRTPRQNQNLPSPSQLSHQSQRATGGHRTSVQSRIWQSLLSSTSFELENTPPRLHPDRRGPSLSVSVMCVYGKRVEVLLKADSATICIANTKNGTKGAVVHHKAFGGIICPVAALARRIANVQAGPAQGPLNRVYHLSGKVTQVSDRDIRIAVRWGATSDSLLTRGYTINRISSHSLRAGGAMAMKLSGASDSTIMRVGRWTSLTYLTYIHSQIGALTAGVAWRMSTAFTFQNVG